MPWLRRLLTVALAASGLPLLPGQPVTDDHVPAQARMVAGNVLHAEGAHAVVVDSAVDTTGNFYVTGYIEPQAGTVPSQPSTIPTATISLGGGNQDIFEARFRADGSTLDYLAVIGGAGNDQPTELVVDASGRAIIAGWTESNNFPEAASHAAHGSGGGRDALLLVLSPSGSAFEKSVRLGGSGDDEATALALAADGAVVLVGNTTSTAFPVTTGVLQAAYAGDGDAFVAKLGADRRSLEWSTYFGGPTPDVATSVVIGADGAPALVGATNARFAAPVALDAGLPVTNGSFSTRYQGKADGFLFKFSPAGTSVVFGGYLGGSEHDEALRVRLTTEGHFLVAGNTFSVFTTDAPITPQVFYPSVPAPDPSLPPVFYRRLATFITAISADGAQVLYSRLPRELSGHLEDFELAPDGSLAMVVADSAREFRNLSTPATDLVSNPEAFLWGPWTYGMMLSPNATDVRFVTRAPSGFSTHVRTVIPGAEDLIHFAGYTRESTRVLLGPATATSPRATNPASLRSAYLFTLRTDATSRCRPDVAGLPDTFATAGGSGVLTISAPPGCPWHFESTMRRLPTVGSLLLPLTEPAAGIGNGTVAYSYPALDAEWNLNLRVEGSMGSFSRLQLTSRCQLPTLSPPAISTGPLGGTRSVVVHIPEGCPRMPVAPVTGGAGWVEVTAETGSTGPFQATVTIAPNTGVARAETIQWGGSRLCVQQGSGQGGAVQFYGGPLEIGPQGGTVSIPFQLQECNWSAASNVPWASVAGPTTGSSCTGAVEVSVEPFSGQAIRDAQVFLNGVAIGLRQFGFDTSLPAEVRAVSDGATFSSFRLAAGGLTSIFGNQLAHTVAHAESIPLSTALGGVRLRLVLEGGREIFAPLLYVSPRQINFQIPDDVRGRMQVSIVASGRESNTYLSQEVYSALPALFEVRDALWTRITAAGYAHLVLPDGTVRLTPLDQCDFLGNCTMRRVDRGPAGSNLHLVLFGTGFPADATLAEYQGPMWQPGFTISYAGRHQDYVGLQQINVRIPRDVYINGVAMFDVAVRGQRTYQLPVQFLPLVD
ncbi:MAG: hypothetical protein KIT83_12585 [Bryobacterales bacterium]|nr:hypothetical protein [Bryobacterales bacterium]